MKKLFIFDYDNTLAQPVSVPSDNILSETARLTKENYVAIMSGRTLKQLNQLFVKNITITNNNLFICPYYGNKIFNYNLEALNLIYETEQVPQKDKGIIYKALKGIKEKVIITEKAGYIAMDCLGEDASNKVREKWDPDGSKRLSIRRNLDEIFKGRFDMFITGRATIDIVAKGRNKADNTVRLAKMLDIPLTNVTFTGDEFYKYGNDYPLLFLKDIQINIIKNPEETLGILKRM